MSFTKKFFFSVVFLTGLSVAFANSRTKRELVPCGSWIYDSLQILAIQNGKVDFSDNAPLTVSEIKSLLSEYDYETLNENCKIQYDKIESYFEEQNFALNCGFFSAGIGAEMNLEGYFKGNDNIDWTYDRYKKQPLLAIPATLALSDYLTMSTTLELQQNRSYKDHNNNYFNIPYDPNQFDINFPDNGYLSCGFDLPANTSLNFRIGMGEQSIGRSLSGSIIFSDYMSGASWANLEIFSPNIKYNMNVTQFNVDKYMYSHILDFRFFKKVQFSAMESILVYAPLELRFLNPLTIFHGMTPWLDYSGNGSESNTCAYMCFKVAYSPVKYLRLYGLYAQDQYQCQYELINWPNDVTPNGLGFQLGAESYIPLKNGNLHFWIEGYYADPYLYIKEDPAWSLVRTYQENIGDKGIFYEWVGSPFGPDTIAGELNAGYVFDERWSVNFNYLFKASGEYSGTKVFDNLNWGGHTTGELSESSKSDWAYPIGSKTDEAQQAEAKRRQALISPSGIPEYLNRIAVRASYKINDYLNVAAQGAFVFVYNRNNVEGNFQCGPEVAVTLKLDVTKLVRSLVYGM